VESPHLIDTVISSRSSSNTCIFLSLVEAMVAMQSADTVTTQPGSMCASAALRGQM
jgi:hypothetical protein